MNKTILNYLKKEYNRLAYTHNYIYGFVYNKCIVFSFSNELYTTLSKGGRDYGYSIRFLPNKKVKNELIKNGYIVLCSLEYFEMLVNNSKYNKGDIFEKLVYEYFNQTWKKDKTPFYESGDIIIDNVSYQIKFEKATFTCEKTIKNAITRKIARS